ncbi:permease-like cell division protein FtsX [Actinoplanes sp. L3-i22]|uniref:permease-like cell division protein FtsX n=1 Tax=Actinoplanes sp. L3-i22 TaxID=2836373 RepID=UPI001C74E58D|nr:permease-like cell division protein FtsX [Actinoplanes sp. L3-i22]BCY11794.1 hypothetical protein L3i22_068820 [Actinoplanes sp. L3-i22]
MTISDDYADAVPEHAESLPEHAESLAEPAVPAPEKAPRRRQFLYIFAVVAASMLIGAAAATGVFLVTGLPGRPEHRFTVNVYLKTDATAEQKAAVEAALPAFDPIGEVTFTDHEKAWQRFQEIAKGHEDVLTGVTSADLPESFSLETKGYLFDCAGYTKVRHMPGVDKVQVVQNLVHEYVATVTCQAEYANP